MSSSSKSESPSCKESQENTAHSELKKVTYSKFQLPENIQITETSPVFSRFVAEPFEKGFGHTIGNSLRRMLLTSLEAPSIISIWIEGVTHEYMSIEGIIEDVSFVILNLKKARFRNISARKKLDAEGTISLECVLDVTQEALDQANGQVKVTFGDLFETDLFEIMNPELELFHVTQPMKKNMRLRVGLGRGYAPSERHAINRKKKDELFIDAIFSPVSKVNYHVENTRIGQDTDYDRLILEISTDGRVTPEEALSFAAQIGEEHFRMFQEKFAMQLQFEDEGEEDRKARDEIFQKLILRIEEIELTVRSEHCLRDSEILTIGELVLRKESEMLNCKNFGKKSLEEIKAKLEEMRLHLGMDLSPYGVTIENAKQVFEEYREGLELSSKE